MNLVVTVEQRFDSTPDGTVWTNTQFPYSFWRRYLTTFEHVSVVARIRQVPSVSADWQSASGQDVSFVTVPYYQGVWQYLRRARHVRSAARQVFAEADAVILRVSSQIANCIQPLLSQTGHPYGVEVVSDPYDVFAPGAVTHPLRPFLRWWFSRTLRRQCTEACAVAYVTEYALQKRYPPSKEAFTTHYSSVDLPSEAFVASPRASGVTGRPVRLIMVGALHQLYKAPDILLEALAICANQGLEILVTMVGDGRYRPQLEAQGASLGLERCIRFLGHLPAGEAVRVQLDEADLFVLPSRTEGLPRAMIEAMARALPCLGSTAGGIPELLPPEDMVPPGDTLALATKIREVVTDPERMSCMSMRNLKEAQKYREEALCSRRDAFYRVVRYRIEEWQRAEKKRHTYHVR